MNISEHLGKMSIQIAELASDAMMLYPKTRYAHFNAACALANDRLIWGEKEAQLTADYLEAMEAAYPNGWRYAENEGRAAEKAAREWASQEP